MDLEPHLLIIDDDARIRELLQKYLRKHGFLVTGARDAAHARRILSGLDFDLMICDVMMPGEDGVSFVTDFRRDNTMPVLMLTAKGSTEDRIAGLEAGADDYLSKPFDPKELLLRVNAILRRAPEAPVQESKPKTLSLGAFRYDVERAELWQGDAPIKLTATEIQLMRVFSDQVGVALSRSELVEKLGRDKGQAQERAVDVQITRLRRKIEPSPKEPRYLQTVRGAGYMLTSD